MSKHRSGFEAAFGRALGNLPHQAHVPQMAAFRQHGTTSTLAHAINVARTSLLLARGLRLPVSERELVRAAVLHDYYLYDWHDPEHAGHATLHPLRAEANAARDFDLTSKERNIISSHMWPLPPTRMPKSREAWLVCVSDKWCTLAETLFSSRR